MRFFYDTEFVQGGYGAPVVLISIGVVAEDGREYFACNEGFALEQADAWVEEHVLPHLPPRSAPEWKPVAQIAAELRAFIGEAPPELWGYCSAYDHVLLVQIFGGFDKWPEGWPFYTCDLRQWQDSLGLDTLDVPWPGEHDALADARWCKKAWEFMNSHAVSS
jgi:hypothetical protein